MLNLGGLSDGPSRDIVGRSDVVRREARRDVENGASARGTGSETASLIAAQRIVYSFRAQNGAVDCFDVMDTDFSSTAQTWNTCRKRRAPEPRA